MIPISNKTLYYNAQAHQEITKLVNKYNKINDSLPDSESYPLPYLTTAFSVLKLKMTCVS